MTHGWQIHDLPPKHQAEALKQLGAGGTPGSCSFPGGSTLTRPAPDAESEIHDYILSYCHSRGWLAIHSRMDRRTTTAKGISDFICITPKTVVFVECKMPGKKPTPEQRAFLTAIRVLGWPNAVVHSIDEFDSFIARYK